jgi:AcrR family transcriptional regulator
LYFNYEEDDLPRKYDMSNRSNSAKRTHERIIEATESLLANGPLAEVTLPAIAESANTTVQTVIRHMRSRDGCLNAVAKKVSERIDSQRGNSKPGDVDSAITDLLNHYEAESNLILNLLEQANRGVTFANDMTERGRIYHRNWVKHCFGPLINSSQKETIDSLVVATDIYIYKLLRLDMGRSTKAAKAIIKRLVQGILK